MLPLQKAEGLPPHFAILDVLKWKVLLQVSPKGVLSLSWQVKPRGHTPPPNPFELNAAGRVLKGASQAPLQLPGCIKKAQHKQW